MMNLQTRLQIFQESTQEIDEMLSISNIARYSLYKRFRMKPKKIGVKFTENKKRKSKIQ